MAGEELGIGLVPFSPLGRGFLTGTVAEGSSFASNDIRANMRPWIVPIPGTKKLTRLDENMAAADLTLTAADLGEIDTACAAIEVVGARYPEHLERMTGL